MNRIVSIDDLSASSIQRILELSQAYLKAVKSGEIHQVLKGKTIANLFFEDSTRTRISFEMAEKRLGAEVLNFSPSNSSIKKGETLLDTLQNILRMKVDLVVVRHSQSGTAHFINQKTGIPVINAGDGINEHPTQALLDLFTIQRRGILSEDLLIELRGDIRHSRVAGSALKLWNKMGIEFTCNSPSTANRKQFTEQVKNQNRNPNLIYNLRIQKERQQKELIPGNQEYHKYFGTKGSLITNQIFLMHPGPVNRGVEMDSVAMSHSNSLILDQVESGLSVRMACLVYLLT